MNNAQLNPATRLAAAVVGSIPVLVVYFGLGFAALWIGSLAYSGADAFAVTGAAILPVLTMLIGWIQGRGIFIIHAAGAALMAGLPIFLSGMPRGEDRLYAIGISGYLIFVACSITAAIRVISLGAHGKNLELRFPFRRRLTFEL